MVVYNHLGDIPVEHISKFEKDFFRYLMDNHQSIVESIKESGQLTDENAKAIVKVAQEFKTYFTPEA